MSNHTMDIAPPKEEPALWEAFMGQFSAFNRSVRATLMSQAALEVMEITKQVEECVEAGGDPGKCLEKALFGTLYEPWMESVDWPFPPPGCPLPTGKFTYRMLQNIHLHVSKMKDLLELELEAWKPE